MAVDCDQQPCDRSSRPCRCRGWRGVVDESPPFWGTDDAFIDARPSDISAQVAGAIIDVPVTDNEVVQPGQPLVRPDDRDYRAAQAQARADVTQAEATISSAEAQSVEQQATIDQMSLEVTQAKAALSYSLDENRRAQTLLKEGSGTLQEAHRQVPT